MDCEQLGHLAGLEATLKFCLPGQPGTRFLNSLIIQETKNRKSYTGLGLQFGSLFFLHVRVL